MISKKMQKALNDQIGQELYSAYLYAAMAAYFEHKNLSGFAQWMTVQAQEEVGHATKFYKYLAQVQARVQFEAIAKPPADFASPLKAFEQAYKHEQSITARIHKLVDLACEDSDHATSVFLQWFTSEQVEEEATALDVIQKIKMVGEDSRSLYLLDRHMGSRAAK
ncbi:MAG: ferritin [Candidatus Hydrogenedentes bacterium]|nr:ferritin [Candidatus Hydrogenedentota bacterium]